MENNHLELKTCQCFTLTIFHVPDIIYHNPICNRGMQVNNSCQFILGLFGNRLHKSCTTANRCFYLQTTVLEFMNVFYIIYIFFKCYCAFNTTFSMLIVFYHIFLLHVQYNCNI